MEFNHFIEAQNEVYSEVLSELADGQKRSHWMWFIFPQLQGLGRSATAQHFALDSLATAERYLRHELLGSRLRECTQLVLEVKHRTAEEIFGYPDWLKFRSSMTLFSLCPRAPSLFSLALDKYFRRQQDLETIRLLGTPG